MGQWCYNLSCQEGNRVTANLENFIKKKFEKPLDKQEQRCYNKTIERS